MIIKSPVGWSNRIHRLHPCRGVRSPLNECPEYNTNTSDGEALALEIYGIWSTPLWALLPGQLLPKVVAPDRVLSTGQIEVFDP